MKRTKEAKQDKIKKEQYFL